MGSFVTASVRNILGAAGVASLLAAAPAMAADEHDGPGLLTVSGTGSATGTPDLAMLTFSVQARGATAKEAVSGNAGTMTAVRDALKTLGIEAKDLQTTQYSVYPVYSRDDRGRQDRTKIIAYEATNALTVRVRDIADVGDAIDQATGAGANGLNGLQFGFQDSDALRDAARQEAVAEARATATLMAEAAGVRLGDIRKMSMSGRSRPQMGVVRMEAMAMDAAPSTPIEAGEGELTATVTIVYELVQ